MNERIKELSEQAGDSIPEFHFGDWNIPNEFVEKFAKLIVTEMVDECARLCVEHAGWTPQLIAHQVKQHFGIEE